MKSDAVKADFILITHGHFDHIQEVVPLAKKFSPKVVAIIRCIALLRNCLGRNADVGRQPLQLLGFPFQTLGAPQTPLAIRLQGNHPGDLLKLRSLGALSCNIR